MSSSIAKRPQMLTLARPMCLSNSNLRDLKCSFKAALSFQESIDKG
jgi:hypothetical protein